MLQYRNDEKNNERQDNGGSNLLSATKPKETELKTGYKSGTQYYTRLKQKSIIKIYVEENNYYIEHSAAYALGLINTRAIMLGKPKLVKISEADHSRLKANDTIEIEYVMIEKKQTLKVYVDGKNLCIDNAAAYALGFISVEEFNNSDSNYYYITEGIVRSLSEKYDIQYYALSLVSESENKKK